MAFVLFPRVLVAIFARTFKSLFSQIALEFGNFGLDTLTNIANAASEQIDNLESVVLNTTKAAMPQVIGATLLALLAMSTGGAGLRLPAVLYEVLRYA